MAVESPPRLPCSLHIPDCPHLHIDLAPPIHKKELDAKLVSGNSRTFGGGGESPWIPVPANKSRLVKKLEGTEGP